MWTESCRVVQGAYLVLVLVLGLAAGGCSSASTASRDARAEGTGTPPALEAGREGAPAGDGASDARAETLHPDTRPDLAPQPDVGPSLPPLVQSVDPQKYETDVNFVATPRPHGSAHWKEVQDLCQTRLQQLGFVTTLQTFSNGTNVVGEKLGSKTPDQRVVISAHYDHVANCPGADDNASGVAAVLETARVLSTVQHDRTLVVGCWDQEEIGFYGSEAHATQAKAAGQDIVAVFVYDMIAYRSNQLNSQSVPDGFATYFPAQAAQLKARGHRGDFIASLYDEHPTQHSKTATVEMENAASLLGLPFMALEMPASIKNDWDVLPDLHMADQLSFWWEDYPALLVTDTYYLRNPNWHCLDGQDQVSTLNFPFAVKVVKAALASVLRLLQSS